jgi:tetratricopeptide (TPR) repeat protein
MVEKSLVYIHSTSPARRFVGCGALIEGGYIATCRHVWRMATAKADPAAPLQVEIEFPWSREGGTCVRKAAELADACEDSEWPSLDLVLLWPEAMPSGVMTLPLAMNERYETGAGYAYAGLAGRDPKTPAAVRPVKMDGEIEPHIDPEGRRQFTGDKVQGYWAEEGSSGSPLFLDNGQQLAGILSLSETGVNQGKSTLHEGFVVPATTIRRHLSRLVAAPVAAKQGVDPAALQPILDQFGARDVPVADIPARLLEFVLAARAQAALPAPRSNEGADIDATIGAARDKVGKFDTDGARAVLQTKIAEEEEARKQRLLPLLKERAAVERLAFDHAAARATYAEIVRLAPDDTWAWFDLGDLWVTAGSLDEAMRAFREGEASARRAGNERDLSVSQCWIGDVLLAKGDLAGALAAYGAYNTVAERLAAQDPGKAVWQRDLSISHNKIGEVREAQGDLDGALAAYRAGLAIRERLAAQDPGNAEWQRDLAVSHNKIGDVRQAQGDLDGALAAYNADLAIAERLAAQNPGNAEWQRDLSVSHEKIGDVRRAQGDLDGALAAYRASLAIRKRLAAQDSGNAEWQRDLSVSHSRIGEVREAQGDLDGAFAAYSADLAIAERLAAQDPGNAGWQRDLAVSHNKIGKVRQAQKDTAGARSAYRKALDIMAPPAARDTTNAVWRNDVAYYRRKLMELGDDGAA